MKTVLKNIIVKMKIVLKKGSKVHLNKTLTENRRLPTQVSFEDILEVTHCSLDHRVERLVLENNILSDDIDELATHYKSNRIIFARTNFNESNLYLAQPRDTVKKT